MPKNRVKEKKKTLRSNIRDSKSFAYLLRFVTYLLSVKETATAKEGILNDIHDCTLSRLHTKSTT
jgi:hypothetical protein